MSSYVYKNLLIVERASKHATKSFVKDVCKLWFPAREPFQYQGDNDRIILYYPKPMSTADQIHPLDVSHSLADSGYTGTVIIQVDGSHLKAIGANFNDAAGCADCLKLIRDYIHQCIKVSAADAAAVDAGGFRLLWQADLLNAASKPLIVAAGLLNTPMTGSHTFKGVDIYPAAPSIWGTKPTWKWGQ